MCEQVLKNVSFRFCLCFLFFGVFPGCFAAITCNPQTVSFYHLGNISTCVISNQTVDSEGTVLNGTSSSKVKGFQMTFSDDVKFLPENLVEKLPRLIVYDVRSTAVTSVEKKHFRDQLDLKYIDLSENRIKSVSSEAFSDCENLVYLYLNDNKISFLATDIFSPLINIRTLSLNTNELFEIPKNFLASNNKLEFLFLDSNRLEIVESSFIDHLSSLEEFTVFKNECIDTDYKVIKLAVIKQDLDANCSYKYDNGFGRTKNEWIKAVEVSGRQININHELKTVYESLKKANDDLKAALNRQSLNITSQAQEIRGLTKEKLDLMGLSANQSDSQRLQNDMSELNRTLLESISIRNITEELLTELASLRKSVEELRKI